MKRSHATSVRSAPAKKPSPKRAADRIRETARDLFYRQGIRAVGVDEIVTRAGVTKPSLYRSFPSKDELAADYLRYLGDEGLARFDRTIAAHAADRARQSDGRQPAGPVGRCVDASVGRCVRVRSAFRGRRTGARRDFR